MRRLGVVAGLAIVGAALVVSLAGGRTGAGAGRPAPPLPRVSLTGAPTNLSALRGRPVLLDFFASWCGPCIGEAPVVARAARRLRGRAWVLGIDWSDSRRLALAFVHRFGWGFPVLFDPDGSAGYAYGIQGLPTAFVLDARGRIARRLIGPQSLSSLARAVQSAVAGA